MNLIYKKVAKLVVGFSLLVMILALVMRVLVDSQTYDPQEQIEIRQRERARVLATLQSPCNFQVDPVKVIRNENGVGFTEIFDSGAIPVECRRQFADVSKKFQLTQEYE